ncbi:hypothetical protein AgCh_001651 [Apium graveolens]
MRKKQFKLAFSRNDGGKGGEEGDKFFNLEDLNADCGRKYKKTKQLNRTKENVVVEFAVADRCALSSSTGMLTESTPNIVRLVGKRRKLGDLPSPVVTPRSNRRVNYMNPLEEETRSNVNDVLLNGREPLNRKVKENYLGFGTELFADEIVSYDEEESNDFNEGPNVVASSFLSDDSEGSDYEASDCESSAPEEPLEAQTKRMVDCQHNDKTVSVKTVDLNVEVQHVLHNSLVDADRVRPIDSPSEGTNNNW